MPTKLRNTALEFNDGSLQDSRFVSADINAGNTNENNVFNTYRNFPIGTKLSHRDGRGTNSGFAGNGSRTLTEYYRRVWEKTGSNSWTEVGE